MQIVRTSFSDLDAIMAMIKRVVAKMHEMGVFQWGDFYPTRPVFEADIEAGSQFCLKDGETLYGIITLDHVQYPEYEGLDWSRPNSKALVVHRLAADPLAKVKRVGERLMSFAEEQARALGCDEIRLDTYSQNQRALDLYDNLGYRRTGQFYFHGKPLPFIGFEKAIRV